MFVETAFKGDKNNKLKKLQNDVYKKQLRIWYDKSRFKYINAVILVNVKTDLFRIVVDKRKFDYNTLQEAYNIIAAYFRYKNPKSNQLKLRFKKMEQTQRKDCRRKEKIIAWNRFWYNEVENLLNNNEITRAVLNTIAYQYHEKGYKAKNKLIKFLYWRYGDNFREKCKYFQTVSE